MTSSDTLSNLQQGILTAIATAKIPGTEHAQLRPVSPFDAYDGTVD
ncbi:hypothetical protein AB4J97_17385 [Serratia fonticola]